MCEALRPYKDRLLEDLKSVLPSEVVHRYVAVAGMNLDEMVMRAVLSQMDKVRLEFAAVHRKTGKKNAANLAMDFDFIEQGERNGLPKQMEWYAAIGVMVTLVWLYLELLRLFANLRERN